LIDQFASEYGWGDRDTLKHTLFQLESYSDSISIRRAEARVELAETIRAAQAEAGAYRRWVTQVVGDSGDEDGERPRGFAYQKEGD